MEPSYNIDMNITTNTTKKIKSEGDCITIKRCGKMVDLYITRIEKFNGELHYGVRFLNNNNELKSGWVACELIDNN